MLSQASIRAPVRASVSTVLATGLPRESRATAFVRQTSFGVPCSASTISCGFAVTFFSFSPVCAARRAFAAESAAFGAVTFGVMLGSAIVLPVALFALRYAPFGVRWTTKSPPRTGSSRYVRS